MPRHTFFFLIDRPRELHKAMRKEKYLPSPPLYHNKHRRINRLDIKIKEDNKNKELKGEYIIIAVEIVQITRLPIEDNG